jgi:hypothetical protein
MRFILDNILLTQETMAWAEFSEQDLIFLKLDFSKAYDRVDWQFLFGALCNFGFPEEFVAITKLLFTDAKAAVKRQGCLLAPYLFLVVAEVLNAMVKREVDEGRIRGIDLPFEGRQQVTLQYADDMSFTLNGEEGSVRRLIQILDIFCLGSGLEFNWLKSSAFWKGARRSPRPAWTDQLRVSWAGNDKLRKLLGAVFGLELSAADVDEFLETKIVKKRTQLLVLNENVRHWTRDHCERCLTVHYLLLPGCLGRYQRWDHEHQVFAEQLHVGRDDELGWGESGQRSMLPLQSKGRN